jgi:hypothetical protein
MEDEIARGGGGDATHPGEMRNTYKILDRKPEGKILRIIPRCKWRIILK